MKTVIKGGDAVKTVARRDSATTLLRKLGIKASDYNLFIQQTTDGRYAVSLDKAAEYLAARLRKVALEEIPQAKNQGRTAKEAASNQIKRPSVAGVIRKYILDGLDNKAIHELLKRDFGHDEDKAHYPAWYRSQMRREGLVERPQPKVKKGKADKPAKPARHAKVKPPVAVKTKTKRQKVAKRAPSVAQRNIKATMDASIKTGHVHEDVAPLSHIQVK